MMPGSLFSFGWFHLYNYGKYDRISEKTGKVKGNGAMIYLFGILVPYLLGRATLRAFYGKRNSLEFTLADSLVVGGMIVIGLTEAAHMGALVLGQSFSCCVKLFLVGLVLLLLLAGILVIVNRRKKEEAPVKKEENGGKYVIAFGLLLLVQVLLLATRQKTYFDGDMTVETVNTMLSSDSIYQINPMTGQAYTLGIPMRLKILFLPTLYGILCDLFGMEAVSVVWRVMPVLVLLGCYAAYYTVSKTLFEEDIRKRWIFMIAVGVILWLADSMYGLDGFGVQYAGFRGVSIRMAVLLPYTVGLVLRRKWLLVILCVFAEACIVWTFSGMGFCLLVALGMILLKRGHLNE